MAKLRKDDIFFFKKNNADHFYQLIEELQKSVSNWGNQFQLSDAEDQFVNTFFLLIESLILHYQKHPKSALNIAKASGQFFDQFLKLKTQPLMFNDTQYLANIISNYRQACHQSRVGLAILEAVSFVMCAAITAIGVALVATLMAAHIGFILAGLSGATFAAVLMLSISAVPALVMGIVTAIETTRDNDWQQLFHPHDEIKGYADEVIEKASVIYQ